LTRPFSFSKRELATDQIRKFGGRRPRAGVEPKLNLAPATNLDMAGSLTRPFLLSKRQFELAPP
jgi:hypothetical protein